MAQIEEASPICRGKNLSWETILLFYNNMPREAMPKAQFHSFTESRINGWTQTHSQIARQLAFYYEKDGMCYPRFTREISYAELFTYMQNWAANYFIPNPYAPSLKGYKPTCIYKAVVEAIQSGESDFDKILDGIFGIQLSSHDKVKVYLSNFTNLLFDDGVVSVNDRASKPQLVMEPNEESAIDTQAYFDFFSSNSSSTRSNISSSLIFQSDDATQFVWECIKLFNKNKELKELFSSDYKTAGGLSNNYIRINGCYVAQQGKIDIEGYESIYTDEEGYINNSFDARNIEDFAEAINDVYKGKYKVEVAPNLYKLYKIQETKQIEPKIETPSLVTQDYQYMSAIKTKPFLILGGFSGTGKSIAVKNLAFSTCPCDGVLNTSETSPGNYLLLSVKPNWHDATDITGFRSSVNRNYYVTDFMRFVVKAKLYEKQNVPFFVCLDEMNLAPVEEYFADFLSVIESRTKKEDGIITTDPLIPASVFNDAEYADDFNIFLSLGIHPTEPVNDITEFNARIKESDEDAFYQEQWLVEELKQHGMTIPQNLVVIGTVNMDDTTNSFSRKVIDRAMTFETVVGEFSVDGYFGDGAQLLMEYCSNPVKGELYISDEIRATDLGNDYLAEEEKTRIIGFINNINEDLKGTPFQISYRVLNETILLYRSKKEINRIVKGKYEEGVDFSLDLNNIFDDILMQKILPRIEGDYDKCHTAIAKLSKRAQETGWTRSIDKLEFMEQRFGNDKSGFTSFWN